MYAVTLQTIVACLLPQTLRLKSDQFKILQGLRVAQAAVTERWP